MSQNRTVPSAPAHTDPMPTAMCSDTPTHTAACTCMNIYATCWGAGTKLFSSRLVACPACHCGSGKVMPRQRRTPQPHSPPPSTGAICIPRVVKALGQLHSCSLTTRCRSITVRCRGGSRQQAARALVDVTALFLVEVNHIPGQ